MTLNNKNNSAKYVIFYKQKMEIENNLIKMKFEFYKKMLDICDKNQVIKFPKINNNKLSIEERLKIIAYKLTYENNINSNININNIILTEKQFNLSKNISINENNNLNLFNNVLLYISKINEILLNNNLDNVICDSIYTEKIIKLFSSININYNIPYFKYITNILDLYIYTILQILQCYEFHTFSSI